MIEHIILKVIHLEKDLMITRILENFLKRSKEMKLEERKEQENLFKSNLNQISRGRFKSKEQKSPPENIELF